jgi:hypothetical protein
MYLSSIKRWIQTKTKIQSIDRTQDSVISVGGDAAGESTSGDNEDETTKNDDFAKLCAEPCEDC